MRINGRGSQHHGKPSKVTMYGLALAFLVASVGSGGWALAARHAETARKAEARGAAAVPKASAKPDVRGVYGALPLSFEANEGQTDPSVQFISHGSGYTLFLRQTDAVLALQSQSQADLVQQKKDRKRKLFEASKLYRGTPRSRKSKKTKTVSVTIEGANPNASVQPLDKLPGKSNYFIGNDPKKWRTGIAAFGRVKYAGVYPGIDLVYYGQQRQLEFDFVVAPGADPRTIGLKIDGDGQVVVTKSGDVRVRSGDESFELRHPEIYQMVGGRRQLVSGGFVQRNEHSVGLQLGAYDHHRQLIIDPTLAYSTYLGGNGTDYGNGIAVDSGGNAYVVGETTSTNFPVLHGYASTSNTSGIAFVSKLSPTGTTLLYSTYLGGTGGESANSVALDPNGNVYVTGYTMSTDFPIVNGFQTSIGTTMCNVFVARIDTTQSGTTSLTYSTYLGGGGNSANPWGDYGEGIAVDASGLAYVTGLTSSDTSVAPFPTTPSAYQSSLLSEAGNAFLTVVDTNQSGVASLFYSTYLGGASGPTQGDIGVGIAVDNSGDAYITGQTDAGGSTPFPTTPNAYQGSLKSTYGNAFVTEISTTQSGAAGLIYSTYLGGSGDSAYQVGDLGYAITLDSLGKVYVAGESCSTDFPLTSGAFETTNTFQGIGFVAKLDLTQSGTQGLLYSSFLGGTNGDAVAGIGVDPNGNTIVAGVTFSVDFPTTSGALQTTRPSNASAGFLTQLNSTGTSLLYSTYLGGSCVWGDVASAVALDSNGNAYITGYTCSTDFPTSSSSVYQATLAGTQNAFVTKFAFNANPGITASASPSPNSSGWNNSSVTVTFTCVPGGAPIQSCSSPAMVSTEGANQVISGTAEDTATNTATTNVTVNLDLTPPSLSITSPTNGASVSAPYVVVSGSVSDALSGVGRVFCNGAPASVAGSAYSCTVPLSSVSNSVTVDAIDLAGNSANSAMSVSVSMGAPTSLQITPGPVTILVGNNQSFTAIDQTGTRRPDATWSVSDPTIATLATDGSGTLTGVVTGQVTLTATIGSVSAQTQVTVLAASSLTLGTALWSAPAVAGFTAQQIVQAVPTTNGPDLYSIETDGSGDLLVRAFTSNGTQLWQNLASGALSSANPIYYTYDYASNANAVGDNSGGVIVVFVPNGGYQLAPATQNFIAHFNGQTGQEDWQYFASGALNPDIAIGQDGTIFAVEQNFQPDSSGGYTGSGELDLLNGASGTLTSQIQLPTVTVTVPQNSCNETDEPPTVTAPGEYGAPIVTPDGSAYLEVQSGQLTADYCHYTYTGNWTVALLKVQPDETSQFETVSSYLGTGGEDVLTNVGDLIPDGQGGVILSWTGDQFPFPTSLADVGPQGIVQTTLSAISQVGFNQVNGSIVLGDNGTAFITDGTNVTAFSVPTLQQTWTYSSTDGPVLSFNTAMSGGGVAVEDSQQGLIQLDSNGNASSPVSGFSSWAPWALSMWPMISNGELAFVYGPDISVSQSVSPMPESNRSGSRGPQLATLVHYVTEDLSASYPAYQFQVDMQAKGFLPPGSANQIFRIGTNATLKQFLIDIKNPVQAVGFIGHALEDPHTGLSVGICFADQCLEKSGANVTGPLGQPAPRPFNSVPNQTAVFFFATCNAGSTFQSLWGITNSTQHRALIVPQIVTPLPLKIGGLAWQYAATALGNGKDAGTAKGFANDAVVSHNFGNFTWRVIGDSSTTITAK